MSKIPSWQLLMLAYFILVALPVLVVHQKCKKIIMARRTFRNFMVYLASVIVTAVVMHSFTLWLYFTFLFHR